MKTLLIFSLSLIISYNGIAQSIKVVTKNGEELEVSYNSGTIKNNGIILNNDQLLGYHQISYIGTDHFDAYDRAMRKAGRKEYEHLNIAFTGNQNLYALQLKKLEEKRNNAHAARGAGGLLMIIGAISGDRDLYGAGLITYGAGTIAKDLNDEEIIVTQNDAIIALQEEQKEINDTESVFEEYRREWGSENVDGLIALIGNDHERAVALANVGEVSKDANHRVAAVWLKAIIFADQNNQEALRKEYDRLIILDPEIESVMDARNWVKLLLDDLNELRGG